MMDTIGEIHDFWFGELDETGVCATDRNALWFGINDATDETCRARFGASLALALAEKLAAWAQTDRGLIALVVLLDQFSRNIHRGMARAFEGDTLALIKRGGDSLPRTAWWLLARLTWMIRMKL